MTTEQSTSDNNAPRLLDELRQRQRDLTKTLGPAVIVTLIGFAIALFFVEPAPPRTLVIATGSKQGDYYAAAQKYAEVFRRNGISLVIRETAGSVENYDLLLEDDEVHLAVVQGGSAPTSTDAKSLESLASLYLEPVWVFHRAGLDLKRLADLRGKRIAVGGSGSGTQALAVMLLNENGVRDKTESTALVQRGGVDAVQLLRDGEVDAIFLLLSPNSPVIRELLGDADVGLMDFDRAVAYSRRFHFLESVVLEPGVIDFQRNLPAKRTRLIAPYANLVSTPELHDAFIPLLLQAASETHDSGGLLVDPGALPSMDGAEFATNKVAREYFEQGPSFFQRHLSFWVASLIDRAKIMLIPFIALLIPLVKLAPPVYRWRIRSRIYRWYAILRGLDQKLAEGGAEQLEECERKLEEMERELGDITVPLSYMEEFYNLRLHLDLVQRRLAELRSRADA